MTGKLYRVIRKGVLQRVGDDVREPEVGDVINVSDEGAPFLVGAGWIAPVELAGILSTEHLLTGNPFAISEAPALVHTHAAADEQEPQA